MTHSSMQQGLVAIFKIKVIMWAQMIKKELFLPYISLTSKPVRGTEPRGVAGKEIVTSATMACRKR